MKGPLPSWIWVVLALALLVSFSIDFENTLEGGSIDLRNRITGARLLEAHIDPYHYKWARSEPDTYCDPYNNPNLKVSKTTASPALLLLHFPLAALPYRLGQVAWFFLQWILLLATAALWMWRCTTERERQGIAIFVTGLTYTAVWRLHAERGQSYVLLLFLFAAWLVLTLESRKGTALVAGLLAGLLIAVRPPFLLLAPFIVWRQRSQLAGLVLGLTLGLGLPLLWSGSCWTDYFTAMQEQAAIYQADFNPHFRQAYPPLVEGMHLLTLARYAVIPYADFSIYALLKNLGLADFPSSAVLLMVLVPFAIWVWLARNEKQERLLLGLAAWFFLIDLFLPAYRNNYNDVLMVNVVALGWIGGRAIPWGAWPCLLALPVGLALYIYAPVDKWMINTPSFLFTVGAILFICMPEKIIASGKPVPSQARVTRRR